METLSDPYWNVITPKMQRLLIYIGEQPFSGRFYLAGGHCVIAANWAPPLGQFRLLFRNG